jgi:SAM-dependent MidA family methyltransferase
MDAIAHRTFAPEISEQFSRALGEAVVRIWGHLPNALQSRLFEEAVTSHHDGELRPRLAVFLHEKHPRTAAARKARAILEPDSLGG